MAEDVVAAGSNVRVTSDGSVGRDAVVAGAQVVLAGDVGRNVIAGTQELTIIGLVGGDVTADAGQVTVAPGASVAGDLTYYSADEATVNGTVGGQTQRFAPRDERGQAKAAEESVVSGILLAILGWVRALVGMLIFAVLVLLALRQSAERAASAAWERPGLSLGIGAAIFVSAFPVAILVFILGLIVGGRWIALVWLAIVWLLAIVGIVIAALALGSWISAEPAMHGASDRRRATRRADPEPDRRGSVPGLARVFPRDAMGHGRAGRRRLRAEA